MLLVFFQCMRRTKRRTQEGMQSVRELGSCRVHYMNSGIKAGRDDMSSRESKS
jgi:hypothetical protein